MVNRGFYSELGQTKSGFSQGSDSVPVQCQSCTVALFPLSNICTDYSVLLNRAEMGMLSLISQGYLSCSSTQLLHRLCWHPLKLTTDSCSSVLHLVHVRGVFWLPFMYLPPIVNYATEWCLENTHKLVLVFCLSQFSKLHLHCVPIGLL